jgi:hypothetical protein
MNNFRFITHLETLAVLAQLHKLQPATWKGVPERGEVNHPEIGLGASILLRGHEGITEENWLDDLPVGEAPPLEKWNSMKRLLSAARAAVMADHDAVARAMGKPLLSGKMARAMLSRLDPGSTIFWHTDNGPYHSRTARFHMPLVTNPLCTMYSGNEQLHMEVGSLWYFNNKCRHSAANWGAHHRVHLIFEMYRADD